VFGTDCSTSLELINILIMPPSSVYYGAMVETKLSLMSLLLVSSAQDCVNVEWCCGPCTCCWNNLCDAGISSPKLRVTNKAQRPKMSPGGKKRILHSQPDLRVERIDWEER
jgi:hypothetical protein